MPHQLKAGLEALSGMDLSGIRVHRNSPKPARVDALAYTQGQDIYLGPGQDKHLPHEGWHAVQQLQGRAKPTGMRVNDVDVNDDPRLESEADRMGAQALNSPLALRLQRPQLNSRAGDQFNHTAQRRVRVDDGATKVKTADYKKGGSKYAVGTKHSVVAMIADGLKRIFSDVAELDDYADGKTDYIGDVATKSGGKFWYRLPKDELTVLGEQHQNPEGNVEDVIVGLQTSRFMYEPFNEAVSTTAFNVPYTGTQSRVEQVNKGRRVAPLVDRAKFNPDLESIVIKALTGASITRNQYIPANPSAMGAAEQKAWGSRPSTNDYSFGERTALYLSIGIHLASDVSKFSFGPVDPAESDYIKSGRKLSEFYLANQTVLDDFMKAKDGDDLVGIYELTKPGSFKNLTVLGDFTLVLHEYATRYIEQLGVESGNKTLEAEGTSLRGNLKVALTDLSPAREEIMWAKIQQAKPNGYLIVGMGDAHRTNLEPRLNGDGIAHEKVVDSLKRQKAENKTKWKP